ncbi:protein-methionine sulfoxide oxidase mical3b-like isoform X3 [Carassius auratus]|uniref:F-actin monooxygenase n=1 Tax=Carassius auratus TaxID=7957 RepID=A0A6P6LJ46_CARAU|nr:protein-methionine sulfoxide oxidase mical3b-like isoform X3 [Carassius auratus]
MWVGQSESCQAHALFDAFVQAATCRETLRAFQELCKELKLHPGGQPQFYHTLRSRLHDWKAKALWAKLDKRASQREYMRGHACTSTTCLIIGAGPCGLRTAIELRFLGARVVLVEKRDAFSRNNVLHLWPFTIQDLRGLGAKKFYGKFCAGAIDHISIRQLQLMLLKVALLLGVEVHVNVEFKHLVEPPEDQKKRVGWRAEVHPSSHPVNQLEFDVVIGADGRRNTLPGFRRKEFRGKLAIAITANFINRNTTAEAKVEEISGVAFIFNQRFFQDLRQATGIDLENIVYYKDDTHYFVMTAKKQSLLDKGVILRDYADTEMLLSRNNVDQNALLSYAHEAADFSTNHQLPTLDFAINHYGQADVAMFDFTCMYASENAAMVRQRRGHPLLVALVGDSLLEPFWPMGTGIARGFLAATDTAWMVRSWGQGNTPSEVLAERESVYRLLPQTTPENVSKNYNQYSVDPATRYPNINMQLISAAQVRHLIDTGEGPVLNLDAVSSPHPRLTRQGVCYFIHTIYHLYSHTQSNMLSVCVESMARYSKLLSWCQEQTHGYMNVCVTDFTTSWRSGLALCALIHRFRPDLINFASLEESEPELNGQLGLDMAELEFGICPIMTGKEMSALEESDSLCMVMYLSQLYELLKDTAPASGNLSSEGKVGPFSSPKSPISLLSKLGQSLSRKRNPKDKKEKEADSVGNGKRRRTSQTGQSEEDDVPHDSKENKTSGVTPVSEAKVAEGQGMVRSMTTLLLAKFEENTPLASANTIRRQSYVQMYTGGVSSLAQQISNQIQSQQDQSPKLLHRRELGSQKEFPVNMGSSDVCYFCGRRVYVMERLSAEGKFFHRSCFQCDHCSTTLRLSNYAYDQLHGRFYCKHHFSYRMTSVDQRKRPAPPVAPRSTQALPAPSSASTSLSSLGSVGTATPPDSWSSSAQPDIVSSLAKRLCGTPERIELENYKPCPKQQDSPLLEVPEETLAQHNLSASLQEKNTEEQSSSSESDLEEEVVWKEEGPNIRTNEQREFDLEEELKEEEGGENQEKQEEEEEEAEDEEEEEEEEEGEVSEEEQDEGVSSDEGEYCPWERERLSGVWLEEEEAGFVKESYEGYSNDKDIDTSSVRESNPCDQQEQDESVSLHQSSTESPPSLKPLESGPTPTPELSTNPENPPVKRSEVVEEFWLRSAEIRKSLGLTPLSRECDPKHTAAQTSNIKESFYTSVAYITSCNSNSAKQTPRNCDSSTQTPSQSTFLPEPSHTMEGNAGITLEEPIGRSSVIHRLSITVEGCVMGDKQDLDISSTSFGNESILNPDTGLPTPPYSPSSSPLVNKQCRAVHQSEPILDREVMVFSSTSATPIPQRDGFKPELNQAWSLPPDEIEILCGDEAEGASRLPERSGVTENVCQMDNRRLEHRRTLPDRLVAPMDNGLEEKEKKRSSLFLPRKSRKSMNAAAEAQQKPGKHKSLWKTVFSKYKKDKKRKEATMVAETLPAATNTETKRKVSGMNRTSDLCFRKNPSFSEDTDLSCHALLERCPLRAQRAETEEELNAKLTRRVQRAARRQAKQEELRRLHRAQLIQRQLEQVEVKQRQLEEKGVAVEKALRGEAVEPFLGSPRRRPVYLCPCCSSEAKAKGTEHDHSVYICTVFFLYVVQEPPLHQLRMGKKDDPSLMHQWFKLVQEKNALVRYESELMIFARELELEDRQSRLQQELRERMAVEDDLKGEDELAEERRILSEMLDVVEQRDALVALLEEQRVREKEEDGDLEAVMLSKGFSLQWD